MTPYQDDLPNRKFTTAFRSRECIRGGGVDEDSYDHHEDCTNPRCTCDCHGPERQERLANAATLIDESMERWGNAMASKPWMEIP